MKNSLKKLLRGMGFELRKIAQSPQSEKQITGDDFLSMYFSRVNPADFFFIQIGAHDGKTIDPIYQYVTKYKLRGIVVEPLPNIFQLLKRNYQDYPGVTCVNAAIARENGTAQLYTVRDSILDSKNFLDLTSLASLDRDSILKTLSSQNTFKGGNPEDHIRAIPVKAMTFAELMREQSVDRVDFLQMDCEGYDYELLKTIDVASLKPGIINMETVLLSDTDRAGFENLLSANGYHWFRHGRDTCAYLL